MKKYCWLFALTAFFFASCSVMVDDFKNLKSTAGYTVEYYFENLAGTEYEQDSDTAPDLKTSGVVGVIPQLSNPDVPGFTLNEEKSAESLGAVQADGTSVYKVYYDRNSYTMTFDPNGGYWADDDSTEPRETTLKFGASLDGAAAEVKLDDYYFKYWDPQYTTVPANNQTFVASWTQHVAQYTLEVYKQNVNDDDYTLATSTKLSGEINETIAVNATEIKGFTLKTPVEEVVLAPSGTVVHVYYDRNSYSLTFSAPGNEQWGSSEKTVSAKFEADISSQIAALNSSDLTKKDDAGCSYVFGGWDKTVPSTMPSSDATYTIKWNKTTAVYTVKYLYENADDTKYVENETEQKTQIGTIGTATTVNALAVTGFEAPVITQTTLVETDALNVVTVKYARSVYTLTFNPNGGYWDGDTSKTDAKKISAKYGANIEKNYNALDCANLKKVFDGCTYTWKAWNATVPSTMPSGSKTFTAAEWTQNTAKYTISYQQENLSGTYEVVSTSDAIIADVGSTTDVKPDSITGFADPVVTNITVTETAASNVVVVKYARNEYTLTFSLNGGYWDNNTSSTADKTITAKYGADISSKYSALNSSNVKKVENSCTYKWAAWSDDVPSTMPAANSTFTVKEWTQVTAKYTVEFYFQNADDDGYSLIPTLKASVTAYSDIGTTPTVDTNAVSGYVVSSTSLTAITADGTAVEKVYYDRRNYTITFDPNGGSWTDGTTAAKAVSVRYGAKLAGVVEDPTRDSWSFVGWTDMPSTCPMTNKTYTAGWTQTAADYTVNYYYQNIDDDNYGTVESETLHGEIGATTSVKPAVKSGFTTQIVTQQTIAASGTVVNVYYNRNVYTLTFTATDADTSWSDTISAKYGKNISSAVSALATSSLTKTETNYDWVFDAWDKTVPDTMPIGSSTYKATWKKTKALYTVNYYFEDASGTYVQDTTLTTTAKAAIGATTDVVASAVDYYKTAVVTNATVKEDATSVVTVKYERKSYTITFDYAGGTYDSASSKTISGKWGTNVSAVVDVSTIKPVKTGFNFKGWNETPSATFATENLSYTAQWNTSTTVIVESSIDADVYLAASTTGTSVTATATAPSTGTWTYKWYIDRTLQSYTSSSFTKTLTAGKHDIYVAVTDSSDSSLILFQTVTVTIE